MDVPSKVGFNSFFSNMIAFVDLFSNFRGRKGLLVFNSIILYSSLFCFFHGLYIYYDYVSSKTTFHRHLACYGFGSWHVRLRLPARPGCPPPFRSTLPIESAFHGLFHYG
jgi:hypothetical protein